MILYAIQEAVRRSDGAFTAFTADSAVARHGFLEQKMVAVRHPETRVLSRYEKLLKRKADCVCIRMTISVGLKRSFWTST